jgi:hypothetical protein
MPLTSGGIRLLPKLGLAHVNAQDFACLGGGSQRGMVMHTQITLEPNDLHALWVSYGECHAQILHLSRTKQQNPAIFE